MKNMPWEMYLESRKMIIAIVLNSDFSMHFSLMTTLKTKLGNNLQPDQMEDRVLILSVLLRCADSFKVARDGRSVFTKWLEAMFAEYYIQGDMERQLELPVTKFMDKDQAGNKEKAYLNYVTVVCRPLLTTFLIMIEDEEIANAILKESIDKNKKSLEQKIDENGGRSG